MGMEVGLTMLHLLILVVMRSTRFTEISYVPSCRTWTPSEVVVKVPVSPLRKDLPPPAATGGEVVSVVSHDATRRNIT